MSKKGLTIKQEKFCNKYLECGNASEAYRFAYDCKKMGENTVWNNAYQLLRNNDVAARLEYLKNNLAEAAGISALMIVREHQKIAFSNTAKLRNGWMQLKDFNELTDDEKACIQTVETKTTKRQTPMGDEVLDEWVKIRLYDKQKSLDSITNILGYNAPVKEERKTQIEYINPSGYSDEELRLANMLIQKAQNAKPDK